MIGVKVEQENFRLLVKQLRKLGHVIASPNLQLHRASRYRTFALEQLSSGALGLFPLSGATKIIAGDHIPGWRTGGLPEHMKVKPAGKNAADVGYFADDSEKIPGKNITYTRAAINMHTGYRIPLTGPEGERVRAFLAAVGVFDQQEYKDFHQAIRKSEHWMYVPPRPFMFVALNRFEESGEDIKSVDQFIEKMMKSPIMEK